MRSAQGREAEAVAELDALDAAHGKHRPGEYALKRVEPGLPQPGGQAADASLDDALSLFEEGTALVKSCTKQLDTAEQKVVRLVKGADGTPIETEFERDE